MNLGVKILIVDDEPMVREAMRQMLEHCGHEVEQVENGEAALAQLARREFDVVITDFSMPGMHGDQLVARIRERLPQQRIIMASGFVDEYRVFGQPGAHVDALLLKPFTFQELLDTLESVLAGAGPEGSAVLPQPPLVPRPAADDLPPPPKL
jgi:CheY-like chemotaxis protein